MYEATSRGLNTQLFTARDEIGSSMLAFANKSSLKADGMLDFFLFMNWTHRKLNSKTNKIHHMAPVECSTKNLFHVVSHVDKNVNE